MSETGLVANVRRRLDNWRLWVVVAYLGLILGVVLLAVTLTSIGEVRAESARAEAIRQATASSSLQRCLEGIQLGDRVNTYLAGVRELAVILVANAEDALAETPRDSPMYEVRRTTVDRLRLSNAAIQQFTEFPVPTAQECASRYRQATGSDQEEP